MNEKHIFSCGCSFPIVGPSVGKSKIPLLDLNLDMETIRLDCPGTWELISRGITKGVFQLESNLGKQYAKKLKPENIEHMAALGSLLRPGSLRALDAQGISMTDHYCLRKNQEEEIVIKYPELNEILGPTYDVIAYQEQCMQIAVKVAGFTEQESDNLRKAIGKKLPEEMAKVKTMFLEKGEKAGVLPKEALEEVFGWIEKSQRYSFNKCIAGDMKIKRDNARYNCSLSIEEMFNIKNSISYAKQTKHLSLYKKWKLLGNYGSAYSLCEDGRIRPNILENIQFIGKLNVYGVILEDGSYIETTLNHKFPTPNGIKMLAELSIGSELYGCGAYEKQNGKKYGFSNLTINDLKLNKNKKVNKAFGSDNYSYTNGSYTLFEQNKKLLLPNCYYCGNKHNRLETHHINGDRSNSTLENLINLCPSCHKKEEYKNGRVRKGEKGYPTLINKIKSIVFIGQKNVYDLTMKAPNHNFVMDNGIVVQNSHAVGYALNGYLSAYCKYHFPLQFYTSYLKNSKETQKPFDEIRELVNDTKLMKIEVKPHDIRMNNFDFVNDGETIYFGLRNIKGVGDSGCKKIKELLSTFDIQKSTWFEILIKFSECKALFEKLILAGCFDYLGLQRQKMLYELKSLTKLSDGEQQWVCNNYSKFNSLKEVLIAALKPKYKQTKKKIQLGQLLTEIKPIDSDSYGATANKNSVIKINSIIELLDKPPISLEDTVDFIVQNEEELMGVAITCSRIDDKNTYTANCTCSEFININRNPIIIAGEIQEIKVIKIKNGQNCGRQMAFMSISDSTGTLPDITIFADAYDKYKSMLQINNTIMLKGKKDYKRKCLIADEIYQL